jgi:hypothetical protein
LWDASWATDIPVTGIAGAIVLIGIVLIGVLRIYHQCKKAMPKKAHEESLVEN